MIKPGTEVEGNELLKELINSSALFFNYVYSRLSNFHYSEEVMQDTAYRLIRNLDVFRIQYIGTPRQFVYQHLRQATIDKKRRIKNFSKLIRNYRGYMTNSDEGWFFNHDPLEDMVNDENIKLFRKCVDELPEGNRDAILLTTYKGYSYREASTMLGISESALNARIIKAKRLLKKRFKESKYKDAA